MGEREHITVEWIGGPEDGDRFQVPEGVRTINVMKPILLNPMAPPPFEAVPDMTNLYLTVPIVRRGNRYFAVWPKMEKKDG